MSPKTFITLAAAAIVAIVAAAVSVSMQSGPPAAGEVGQRLFPGLIDRVNDVRTVEVLQGDNKRVLARTDKGWVAADRDNYPVRDAKVEAAVLGFADLTLLEPKTAMKDRYAKLAVEDPAGKTASSKLVRLLAADGKALAEAIVGRAKYSIAAGGGPGGVYVRKPDAQRAWLAKGSVDVGMRPDDWLRTEIVDVDAKRIRKVVITHPDGETVTVSKEKPEEKGFTLAGVPEGMKAKGLDDVTGPLARMEMWDVRRSRAEEFPKDKTVIYEATAFDGLVVRVALYRDDEKKDWARVVVTPPPALAPAADANDAKAKKAQELVRQAAEAAKRVPGWDFLIPDWKAPNMTKRLKDLTEPIEKPAS